MGTLLIMIKKVANYTISKTQIPVILDAVAFRSRTTSAQVGRNRQLSKPDKLENKCKINTLVI